MAKRCGEEGCLWKLHKSTVSLLGGAPERRGWRRIQLPMRSTSQRHLNLVVWRAGGTPEDLLLCAVASCYTTTFRALAEYSGLEYEDLGVEVEGAIHKTNSGYSFNGIVIRPSLTISAEEEQGRALRLLQKAKALCLVSRALSVEQKFEPRLQVGELRVEFSQTLPVS
jgi:peroxiredoxin-like protein